MYLWLQLFIASIICDDL